MTEPERLENQRYYIECCRREGWMDEQYNHLWPEDPEARAEMGRGLFGLALTNALDSIFLTWRERALNPHGRMDSPLTPGCPSDLQDRGWRDGFATLTGEQRDFVLRVIDDVLDFTGHTFAITLDRFDHGQLSLHLTVSDDQYEPKFTVPIHSPDFSLEMFQEILAWRERFGRGASIGRPTDGDHEG